MKHLGDKVAAMWAFAAKEEQGRNSERGETVRFKSVMADTPQFAMNRMSSGQASWPARSRLQGSKLMGW